MNVKLEIIKQYSDISNKYLPLFRDLVKYGLASIVAMVLDVGLLYVLVDYVTIYYLYAATIAFCSSLIFHYVLVKLFVFKLSRVSAGTEFFWYCLIGLVGLILNNLIIYILVTMQIWYIFAKLVSLVTVFIFNFSARRRLFMN